MAAPTKKILGAKDFEVPELVTRPLGDMENLVKSILQDDLKHPIILGQREDGSRVLLSGYRRLCACDEIGWKKIPCIIVDNIFDAADLMEKERLDDDDWPEGMYKERTISEQARLGMVLEEFNLPAVHRSRLLGSSKGGATPRNPLGKNGQTNRRETSAGKMRIAVTKAVGASSQTSYQRAGYVYRQSVNLEIPPEERKFAEEVMEIIDGTGSVAGNYLKVRGHRNAATGPQRAALVDTSSEQRRMLNNAANALRGLTHGLDQINHPHPQLREEEVARWIQELSVSRRSLETVIKMLKKRLSEMHSQN